MADIVVVADRVARVFPRNDQAYSAVAAVAITAGALVYFNSAGKLALSDASGARVVLLLRCLALFLLSRFYAFSDKLSIT